MKNIPNIEPNIKVQKKNWLIELMKMLIKEKANNQNYRFEIVKSLNETLIDLQVLPKN